MSTIETRTGGCLCGQVRYTAPLTPFGAIACHCKDCQRLSGGTFSVSAFFSRNDVAIQGNLQRFDTVGESGNIVERYFCGNCGTPVYIDAESTRSAGLMVIKVGTLDDASDINPTTHYWVRSKQEWVQLPEGATGLDKE